MTSMGEQKALPGRRGQAARNDGMILDAAREVFLEDPKAPIAAVAERAGVGISALYRRYANKEDLLRRLCADGLRRYLAEAEAALEDPDGWRAFAGFLRRVVDADVHSLTVRLAGTFTSTPEMAADAERSGVLTGELVKRAHAHGGLRADVVSQDVGQLLELCAAIRAPDADRTTQLRRRYLAILLDGLAATGAPLPGPPPKAGEFASRWKRAT
jgi:AcrR family transcriptional regulator